MDEAMVVAVTALEGRRLWGRGRACEMETLHFGARVEDVDFRGRHRIVGEWALHLSGAWRIVCEGRVLVGREDWLIPAEGVDEDHFDADSAGQSRRDRFMDRFMAHGEFAHLVDRADVSGLGDLTVVFADGCVLETLTDIGYVEPSGLPDDEAPADAECWRLFQPAVDGPHHVIGPGGRVEHDGNEAGRA